MPFSGIFNVANILYMSFNSIRENKTLAKISESTVYMCAKIVNHIVVKKDKLIYNQMTCRCKNRLSFDKMKTT